MSIELGIIGGGPAGLTASVYACRAGYRPVLWEGSSCGGQMLLTPEIENYPGVSSVTGMDLADAMTAQAEALGVDIRYDAVRSVRLADGSFRLSFDGTEDVLCRALVIASGASHRSLGVPGEEEFRGRGVSYCAVCDGRFFSGKDVAVVGGGNTALGDAMYLSRICRSVTVVHRRDAFRADKILVERAAAAENIRFVLSANVEAVLGTGRVEALRLRPAAGSSAEKPWEISASAVFIAVGNAPQSGFLSGIPELVLADGYVPTDERCRTSVPGLFAAGDIRVKSLRQIATAVSDGAVAGTEAAAYLGG